MHRGSDSTARWLAALACLILVCLPARGATLCRQLDGGWHLGLGAEGGCPCPGDDGPAHPPCEDIPLDGPHDALPGPGCASAGSTGGGPADPLAWLSSFGEQRSRVDLPPPPTGPPRTGCDRDAGATHSRQALRRLAVDLLLI